MEPEERPSKIRKLDHNEEPVSAPVENEHPDQQGHEDSAIPETPNEETKSTQGEADTTPKLSKNQLKKQRRLEAWEAGREDRKIKRKEKIKAKKERRREERRQQNAEAGSGGAAAGAVVPKPKGPSPKRGTQVPITVIFDCAFEDFMFDNEMKSLGLQITRCYSDNRKAKYQTHLAISSFGGKMKERFDGILAKQYTSWKGVRFFSEDFVEVAEKAKEWMGGSAGGAIAGALAEQDDQSEEKEEEKEEEEEGGEIVYLSSESDVVLERLKPNSTYIIGGLVDKNRHKGLCYKRALNRGIKTAKLPIGEFLHMKSRQVLVTNHVLEIMLKWLEFGDWGKAFMEVLPKRKGGVLRSELEATPQADSIAGSEADGDVRPEEEGEPANDLDQLSDHSEHEETTKTTGETSTA
ncbi:uncharacterized protein EI97DRAFT_394502 [Westerdykella ornata]|uniref:tRNA (guanine(9)-N1)-methyltransferase n=1 Tax=Westerdykella ornata TaxID=318751 RepID=A0A6A6JTE5_WESOR|nr:uncharacterized protein EI97DRAFT_394502 [Westerdykella ornata]KAF2278269.1 hypothetical protein EI97DRAFT_394502 [Westerdykella ornata]